MEREERTSPSLPTTQARRGRGCLLAALACLAACGRDPAQVRWDDDFAAALARAPTDPDGAAAALRTLAETAPRAVDEGAARFELIDLMRAAGRDLDAARALVELATHGRRQDDRARAYYELARLAEDEGRVAAAERLYRDLVRTYPNLMPGERSLAHLLRLARARGVDAVDRHLAWTRSLADTLAHTSLADDLLYQAADEARRRAAVLDTPASWARAEALYRRLAHGPKTPLWNDAWWELSWIFHRQRRFAEEIAALETILRSREVLSLFGQDEHPYFWQGQLRIARVRMIDLADPRRAIADWLRYAELFPRTIKKDDVRFYALCAALQAHERRRADELEALLSREHPDSRFLRDLPAAHADPHGPACTPPEAER